MLGLSPVSAILRLFGLLVFATALLSVGCAQPHLAGTNDAKLEYRVTGPNPPPLAAVREGIKLRLVAAQLTAEVDTAPPDGIRVTVDADAVDAVDALVRWRGGLLVYRQDPSFSWAPADMTGLDARFEAGGRYFVGPLATLRRAIATSKLQGRRVFVEPLDRERGRTRVVAEAPVVDLSGGASAIEAIDRARAGRALAIRFLPARVAEMSAAAAASPGEEVVFARGGQLVAVRTLESAIAQPVVFEFGDDVYAFALAYQTRKLLGTPTLPPLTRTAAQALPSDWGVATASVVLPLVLSFAWLAFVRRFDRAQPEPWWLITVTFLLGCVSVVPAALLEYGASRATPYLDPHLMTLGGQLIGFPTALVCFTVVVGVSEELAKFLGAWALARHRREFDEPVDGIVYGVASSLGFAAVENVKYFGATRMSGTVIAMRTIMSVPAHMFFGAIWGYAMGRKLVRPRTSVLAYFALAALAHGAFDTFLSIDGMQALAILLNLALAVAFVVLLRRSLRHGIVERRSFEPADAEAPASSARALFRIGSFPMFLLFGALMVVLGFVLVAVGVAYESLQHRVGIVFFAIASTLLAMYGLAAYGLTAVLPLDVAVDPRGITFAGISRPWATILGFERQTARGLLGTRGWIRLRTQHGDMRLGPASLETTERLALMLAAQLGDANRRA